MHVYIDWVEHCPWVFDVPETTPLVMVINVLLEINTCFIVNASDRQIHTTDRGRKILEDFQWGEV